MSSEVLFLLKAFERCDAELQDAKAAIARVRQSHVPIPGDQYAKQRCRACICGYDPKTGLLVHAAWPCSTIAALDDKE